MTTTIIGFPRIGEQRELKYATEKYFKNEMNAEELETFGQELRQKHWQLVKENGIDLIPSNDFSFYDTTLDTSFLLNVVPAELETIELSVLDKYFALARGYQGEKGDIKARPMKKWFNTNYHYIVPKIEATTEIKVAGTKIFDEYLEAKALGIETRPVVLGPFTFLQLSELEEEVDRPATIAALLTAYKEILARLAELGAVTIQLDEPSLVKDLSQVEIEEFKAIYQGLLADKPLEVLLQTYFGDVRDIYQTLIGLPFDAIGLDFVEGIQNQALVQSGFPQDRTLYAGIVNGKNIWRNDYQKTIALIQSLNVSDVVLGTSCSLIHVPFTTKNELFPTKIKQHFAFAKEKLTELLDLNAILLGEGAETFAQNKQLFASQRFEKNEKLSQTIAQLSDSDFTRKPVFSERETLQKSRFDLPILPTTTIGSFPQTREIKQTRAKFKRQEITQEVYDQFVATQINDWLSWQESIGLDVLVHGEFERNDMVEYFGQNLSGYLFSQNGWVQSYGTRGVKPPIIWGDVAREQAITVKWSKYAQSQTNKIVKGMLTGPVTILNWSFPREDIHLKESTYQIALAIQEEVLDLEANGIKIIQIDEAALREKLPLRKTDWHKEYLDWAIPAFRLVHSKVQPETQIHTHMCYSEFTDIIPAIDQMDADVISFEASRSNLEILDELQRQNFKTQVGPGVYDIHSPRIPTVEEIKQTIQTILTKVSLEKVWINPDCGLKTRGMTETRASLVNMTEAVRVIREEL